MVSEIISTVERRRHWCSEEKLRIISEALEPGVTIASVADRNGVCRSLVYAWLKLARENRLPGISRNPAPAASFVPVRIAQCQKAEPATPPMPLEPTSPEVRSPAPPRGRLAIVEIAFGNGRVVKVEESINPSVLARLVAVLGGAAG